MIDLSKKYPGYFNKGLIRTAFLAVALLGLFVFVTNGCKLNMVYVECPAEVYSCNNPYYCSDNTGMVSKNIQGLVYECVEIPEKYCEEYPKLCSEPRVPGGETYGQKPSFVFKYFNFISFGIIAFAFGLNHIIWVMKKDVTK